MLRKFILISVLFSIPSYADFYASTNVASGYVVLKKEQERIDKEKKSFLNNCGIHTYTCKVPTNWKFNYDFPTSINECEQRLKILDNRLKFGKMLQVQELYNDVYITFEILDDSGIKR